MKWVLLGAVVAIIAWIIMEVKNAPTIDDDHPENNGGL